MRRDGIEQHLRQKTFQVLAYLLDHRDRVVPKSELLDAVWSTTAVTEDTLVQSIVDIRKVVGDDPRDPWFLKTVPKAGYRLIAPIQNIAPAAAALEIESTRSVQLEIVEEDVRAPSPARVRLAAAAAGAALLLAAAGILVGQRLAPKRVPVAAAGSLHTVAVMFFEKEHGGTDVDWLREGLADMLITSLSRSGSVSVVRREDVAADLHRQPSGAAVLPLEAALDLARRSHADRVIVGQFAQIGNRIRIDARLHDATNGRLIGGETLVTTQGDLLARVDSLADGLSARIASRPVGPQQPLGSVATADLEAYRLYSLGVERVQGLYSAEAIELFQKALDRDPRFAMALARIGYTWAIAWSQPDKGRPYLERALKLPDRLTPHERMEVAAWYAIASGDYAAAIEQFRLLTERYPSEPEAYARLGRLLAGEERLDEAIEVLQRGFRRVPDSPLIVNALGGVLSAKGRYREAIAMHRRYVTLAADEPNSHDSLGLSLQASGDYAGAMAEYQTALRLNPRFEIARIHLANSLFQLGRFREATAQFRQYIATAPSNEERARGWGAIAWVSLARKDIPAAEEAGRRAVTEASAHAWTLYLIELEKGNRHELALLKPAVEAVRTNNRGARPSLRFQTWLRGQEALSTGDEERAIALLRETLRYQPVNWNIDSFERCLADAYLQLGRPGDAAAEYERVLSLNPNDAFARYGLGLAYERLGRTSDSHGQLERFLAIWSNADPDLPQLIDARRRVGLPASRFRLPDRRTSASSRSRFSSRARFQPS